jgi:hypothetical protein
MADSYETHQGGLEAPARDAFAITPNDSTDLAVSTRALYVGGTGNVKVDTVAGTTVTFTAVPVGILPVRVRRVHSTGTTATNIVGMV